MTLLRRMFGLQSADEIRAKADQLFEGGEYGAAKLAYERSLEKAKDASDAVREELRGRVEQCRDAIAEQRITEARTQAEAGNLDLARAELEGAMEVAASPAVADQARQLIDGMEQREALDAAHVPTDITEEERLALIAGSWEEPQAREYEAYGEPLEQAILALHDEQVADAREVLEGLLEEAKEPRYLWLEVGRARLLSDDVESGSEALRSFLGLLEEGEGGEARLGAHLELARLADERGDFDAAVAEFDRAIEALDEDPRPYLWLGRFLRTRNHAEEAIEVFEAAIDLMDQAQPDWRVLQELGLAQAEAGRKDDAIGTLERVLTVLSSRRHFDFPPETASTLARLHEEEGRLERAADLYRALTRGSDHSNMGNYHREAGRVLGELGLLDEARRMLQRAAALTSDDAEAHAEVQRQLESLGRTE